MKTTEVVFKRNYAISPLTMEHMHLQVTVAVEEGESTSDALKYAQDQVESFYKEACAMSRVSEYPTSEPMYTTRTQATLQMPLLDELVLCDNLETLKSYRFTHKTPEEQQFYDDKIKSLTK